MNRDATDLAGVRHKSYETLGSTNAEALALARAGERGPLWVSALAQTAGRGRRNSTWASPPGNLYATLLVNEPSLTELAPQLSFVTALALHDAVVARAPQLGPLLAVKWPNDLLLGMAKVAGILIEGESGPTFSVAIGIGVNCAAHPRDTAFPATDLASAGPAICCCAAPAARSPSPPAKSSAWAEPEPCRTVNRNRTWCSRRSAASAKSA
ncbi:MAG: biotin--[acetyl-CoA-carboxylase] ligase [Rhizobiales bacterium]|nr:biotin--[acetyl-CoA-carboxylase] ligase [Hyphomicrobiales bacterium]